MKITPAHFAIPAKSKSSVPADKPASNPTSPRTDSFSFSEGGDTLNPSRIIGAVAGGALGAVSGLNGGAIAGIASGAMTAVPAGLLSIVPIGMAFDFGGSSGHDALAAGLMGGILVGMGTAVGTGILSARGGSTAAALAFGAAGAFTGFCLGGVADE